jgi:hypothetical protein
MAVGDGLNDDGEPPAVELGEMPKTAPGLPRPPRGVDPAILLQVVLLMVLPSAATLAAVAAGVATSVMSVLGWAFGTAGLVWSASLPLAWWLHDGWVRKAARSER